MVRRYDVRVECDDNYPFSDKKYAWRLVAGNTSTNLNFCTDERLTSAQALVKLLQGPSA